MHLNSEQLRDVCDDTQILENENEYYIEKSLKIVTKDKRRCYDVTRGNGLDTNEQRNNCRT